MVSVVSCRAELANGPVKRDQRACVCGRVQIVNYRWIRINKDGCHAPKLQRLRSEVIWMQMMLGSRAGKLALFGML